MTSANRSSEPIAYEDDDALERLAGIADAFLIGERPIARRVDDSVARVGAFGPAVLRRARGYAPGAVATLPTHRPILAVGADLKNTITLVVEGQAFVSQHIGDLDHYQSFRAFQETIYDLVSMYEVDRDDLLVVHDLHPQYASTAHAEALVRSEDARRAASSRAHRFGAGGARRVDQARHRRQLRRHRIRRRRNIWGGEFFVGSLKEGFERVAHLRRGGSRRRRRGGGIPGPGCRRISGPTRPCSRFYATSLSFPGRYQSALELVHKQVRTFLTTSVGRLFDAAAALLGFTREISFEGQAAMWLEQLAARRPRRAVSISLSTARNSIFVLCFSSSLKTGSAAAIDNEIARAFQRGIAQGLQRALIEHLRQHQSIGYSRSFGRSFSERIAAGGS